MSEQGALTTGTSAKSVSVQGPDAKAQVLSEAAHEFVFAVVGHIGSGTSNVAESFQELLSRQKIPFETTILKARDVIESWSKKNGHPAPLNSAPRSICRKTAIVRQFCLKAAASAKAHEQIVRLYRIRRQMIFPVVSVGRTPRP